MLFFLSGNATLPTIGQNKHQPRSHHDPSIEDTGSEDDRHRKLLHLPAQQSEKTLIRSNRWLAILLVVLVKRKSSTHALSSSRVNSLASIVPVYPLISCLRGNS